MIRDRFIGGIFWIYQSFFKNLKAVRGGCRVFQKLFWRWSFVVSFPSGHMLEPLLISGTGVRFLRSFIQRTVTEQMPMFIAFFASKWDMFIFKRLDPVGVFMGKTDRIRESFCNVHENTNYGI